VSVQSLYRVTETGDFHETEDELFCVTEGDIFAPALLSSGTVATNGASRGISAEGNTGASIPINNIQGGGGGGASDVGARLLLIRAARVELVRFRAHRSHMRVVEVVVGLLEIQLPILVGLVEVAV
jgi:hypothetical protein